MGYPSMLHDLASHYYFKYGGVLPKLVEVASGKIPELGRIPIDFPIAMAITPLRHVTTTPALGIHVWDRDQDRGTEKEGHGQRDQGQEDRDRGTRDRRTWTEGPGTGGQGQGDSDRGKDRDRWTRNGTE